MFVALLIHTRYSPQCENTIVAPEDVQGCIQEIRQKGYCILRRHFPLDVVEACRVAFEPIAEAYLEENADNPNRGPHRHFIPLPFRPPFYHPAIFNDDTIHAIAEGILGEQMVVDHYATDTPFKGSSYQEVHADLQPLFPEQPDLVLPPELLAVNWPFVDVTQERGPFQVAEGTHLLPRTAALARVASGEIPLNSLLMEAGDVLIRDPRCLHRGSPNLTDTPRVVAVISFMRPWFCRRRRDTYPIARSLWNTLSEREQRLLQRIAIDD